mmetsp:Transcript_82883/g.173538  ORF Transcript_82883/g.173538 Transcript_82883/m.173538 type:complete len:412 (-) Transcript_82883:26-1261(-)
MSTDQRIDEFEALTAIFGDSLVELEDPSCIENPDELALRELVIRIKVSSEDQPEEHLDRCCTLRITLPTAYPDEAAAIVEVLPSMGLSTGDLKDITEELQGAADSALGTTCIFDLCLAMKERLTSIEEAQRPAGTQEEQGGSLSSTCPVDDGDEVAVVALEHMNDVSGYSKKLREWAKQRTLVGIIFHRVSEKSGRWEDVFVILVGSSDDISAFVGNLKSQLVDKDSKGTKCKERKSEVLFRGALSDTSLPWDRQLASQKDEACLPSVDYMQKGDGQADFLASLDYFGLDPPVVLGGQRPKTSGGVARDTQSSSGVACILSITAKPNARASQITNASEIRRGLADSVHVDINAVPKDGEANKALCALLAGLLGVPRANVSVLRGGASRTKEILVEGMSSSAALHLLGGGSA